jgi:6-phosphogluconolactonase
VVAFLPVAGYFICMNRTGTFIVIRAGILILALFFSLPLSAAEKLQGGPLFVYAGTYTGGKSKGIYLLRFEPITGQLNMVGLAAESANPSFLALHSYKPWLYAVNEIDDFGGKKSGAVSAFAIEPGTKMLRLLNQQPSQGAGPCHLVIDRAGQYVLTANYGGGSVVVLPIRFDGGLGQSTAFFQFEGSSNVNSSRQEAPHAHSVNVDMANRFAAVADLGQDKVLVFRFNPMQGTLRANNPPSVSVKPGAGPRHFAFHPNGQFAYVINELNCTVTVFDYNGDSGMLREIETVSTLLEKFKPGYSTAEVQIHPSGRFLYGSNRGHDSIAVFSIDPQSGRLTLRQNQHTEGKTPRNFGIDPSGTYLLAANQDSDTIVVFRIDQLTGRLAPNRTKCDVPRPVCVKFLPAP